jgi:hypothetical protein
MEVENKLPLTGKILLIHISIHEKRLDPKIGAKLLIFPL